jgi:hypothetical protein
MTFFVRIYILLRIIIYGLFYFITYINYLWVLFIAKIIYCLNKIDSPFDVPSPHSFPSERLTSGYNPKETYAKITSSQKILTETSEVLESLRDDYKALKKCRTLHNAQIPENQNNILKDLKEEYPHFFDDNTSGEGMKQLSHYFKEEMQTHNSIIASHRRKINNWHKELQEYYKENTSNSSSSNSNVKENTSNSSSSNSDIKKEITPTMDNQYLLPLFTIYFNSSYLIYFYRSTVYLFRLILPLLGIIVSLNLVSITIPTYLVLFSEIFFNRLVFLWSCFRVYRNIKCFIKLFNFIKDLFNNTDYPDLLLWVLITIISCLLLFYLKIGFSMDVLLCS